MAERIEGLSIGLDLDTLKLDSGLKDLNKKMSLVNSEMKANMSAFDRGESSIKKYQTQLEGLNKKLDVQKTRVDSAKQAYDKMASAHGESSQEAEKAATAYNNEVASLNNLAGYVQKVTEEMVQSESYTAKFRDGLTKISEKADELGNVLTATVTPAMVGVATAAVLVASNFGDAVGAIQINLGATEEEALRLGDVANDVFKDGWGESLAHVTDSLITVREQLGEMADEDLAYATKQAIALEQAMGMDQGETLRGINSLMETYGMTVQEAFDYMVKGAQNGLNKTDELGDNLAEYAGLFEENGYSAGQMFSILEAGLDGGAYNLDKVNDLVKEFGIRATDGTILKGVENLGGSWQEIYDGWAAAGGTNAELFDLMAKNLQSIEDPQEKQLALTEIWGSIGEDAGFKVIESMGGVTDSYNDVNGAAQEVVDTMEATQAQQFAALWRDILDNLVPVGDILLEVAEDALPILQDAVEDLTVMWNSLTTEQQEMVVKFGAGAAAAGPLIKVFGGLAGGAAGATGKIVDLIAKIKGKNAITGALESIPGSAATAGGAIGLFSNPWILGIGAITAVVAGIGYYVYQEATSHERDHQESITNTQGKYEDWFNAVTEGATETAEAQKQIQDATNTTGETYEEMTKRIKEQNQDVVDNLKETWAGLDYDFYIDPITGDLLELGSATKGLSDKLIEVSGVTEESLAAMEEGYLNYGTMIGNTLYDLMNTYGTGQIITEEYANATINTLNATRDEVVASLEEQKLARQAELDNQRENLGPGWKEEYQKQTQLNNVHYSTRQQTIENTTQSINDILATASLENRELTADEVSTLLFEYEKLATGTGSSLSNVEGAQNLLKENMRAMVTDVGLQAAVQTGIISQETANQIASLNNEKDRVDALRRALENYNGTTVPPKQIHVSSNAEIIAINAQTAINRVTGKRVYLDTVQRSFMDNAVYGPTAIRNATGNDSFPGGLAILGDGGRQEPFLEPSGRFGISPPTDTMYNLEQGTKIWPSLHDFKLDIPRFATGTQGSTEVQRLIANYRTASNERSSTVGAVSTSQVEGDTYNLHLTVYGDMPDEMIQKMARKMSIALHQENEKTKRKKGVITNGPR